MDHATMWNTGDGRRETRTSAPARGDTEDDHPRRDSNPGRQPATDEGLGCHGFGEPGVDTAGEEPPDGRQGDPGCPPARPMRSKSAMTISRSTEAPTITQLTSRPHGILEYHPDSLRREKGPSIERFPFRLEPGGPRALRSHQSGDGERLSNGRGTLDFVIRGPLGWWSAHRFVDGRKSDRGDTAK
jgi:hypothetical protein